MPRKRQSKSNNTEASQYQQLELNLEWDSILNSDSHKILTREQVINKSYDPVEITAEYVRKIVSSQKAWKSTLKKAREKLLTTNAKQLYLDFLLDIKRQIEENSSKSPRLARLLKQVAIRGLGMTKEQVKIYDPPKGSGQWRVDINTELVEQHLESHIVGENFLNLITADNTDWKRNLIIASSDVSQHRSSVPTRARFFTRTVPFVLNNAVGAILRVKNGKAEFDLPRFNPQPDQELIRWMLIDPSYEDELEPEDYQRCTASAMDVGQYKFDHQYLLNADKDRPDIILRDGSLFPQDAYLDNFLIDNRRGEFTREAIRELLNCLLCARAYKTIYCGVSKNVQLKVYSAILDWYITKEIDPDWETGNYTLNDGQMMTLLLGGYRFKNNLTETIATCLIRRSFTTRAALNEKANLQALDSYFNRYEKTHDFNISPYRELCNIFHVYMFFMGHSKSPSQLLPRYEFFHDASLGSPTSVAQKILTAIQYSGVFADNEHSFSMSPDEEAIIYLIPRVTMQAHRESKNIGEYLTQHTKQLLMSRYKTFLSEIV
ncbi:hypothetical protein QUA70_09745 [Microcoleus sp. LAD1_D5]|uniref:hypothetical protein n=1 Tax=unclassified Microcoleus TaxID=2642155 RepID=UPI002FD45662